MDPRNLFSLVFGIVFGYCLMIEYRNPVHKDESPAFKIWALITIFIAGSILIATVSKLLFR